MNRSYPVVSSTTAPLQANGLPVVQFKQSHDLALDPEVVPAQGALAVIPAYAAMAENDQVGFTWRGFFDEEPILWQRALTVSAEQVGRPLQVYVPRAEVLIIEDSHAEILYSLLSGHRRVQPESPIQTFRIEAPTRERLLPPSVLGHVVGEPLDPADFPQGIVLRHPAYPGMQTDDYVVLYGDGTGTSGSFVDSKIIERFHVEDGWVDFHIAPGWLVANDGGAVTLFYQFARPGEGQSSEPLALEIRKAEPLPPPIVERALAESGQYQGYLLAQHALDGVFVRVPDTVPLAAGDRLIVHWLGHPAGGQHVATSPVHEQDPRRFFIPASAVPANMGVQDSKRFDVVFQLVPAVGKARFSTPFGLRIVPLDQARYPVVQWDRLGSGTRLSLQTVPADGEPLRLDSWPFMSQGQQVSLELTGVDPTGAPVSEVVRDALPVTQHEAAAGKVIARVPRAFLAGLKFNQYITLMAAVSFDGGETRMPFLRNSGVQLVP